ncbi:MAG: NUDIX domain-containing protein [Theionarchaea archaeon]|nr:NUDIX domain-containing protein [Theionarchaea archaeon]
MTQDILTTAGRLFSLEESDFDVSTGLLIKFKGDHVFVVHNPDRWVIDIHKKDAGVVGVGGKLEQGETILECVKRECREEICTDVTIADSKETYVVTDEHINTFKLDKIDEPRPYFIILLKWRELNRKLYTVVFSYKGDICDNPNPGDVSAILLAKDTSLYYLRSGPKTVKFMKKHSTIIERIHLPDDLYLIPYGTLLTYLKIMT